MFKHVDSDAKAYLLGFIASDGGLGHGGRIMISIHERDIDILYKIKRELKLDIPISRRSGDKANMVGLSINSTEMMDDIARLLGVPLDKSSLKKDRIVQMPMFKDESLQWAFIRGYFDGDGSISAPTRTRRSPQVAIASMSTLLKQSIRDFCKIPCTIDNTAIWWYGNNALDFLERLYGGSSCLYMNRKADLYAQWSMWVPSLLKGAGIRGGIDGLQWTKNSLNAIPPSKTRASDSGYDLTAIDILKVSGDVTFYRTGIKITPPFGYYCDLVARSSISATGYVLANGIGVIDRTYVGEIIIPLRKIDKNAKDLELPCRIAQIVPRQIVHFELIEVKNLEPTERSDGGFGSTTLGA